MLFRTIHYELPQRVMTYYLLFCLVATLWLAVGVTYLAHAVFDSRSENSCLALIGRGAAAASIENMRDSDKGLQELVERLRLDGGLNHCAFVGTDGRYRAHTDHAQVGQLRSTVKGEARAFGAVTELRYVDGAGEPMLEFRCPVLRAGEPTGELLLAQRPLNIWATAGAIGERAPIAVLGPLVLLFIGGLVLQRSVRGTSLIESQLRRVASAPTAREATLGPVPVRGAAAYGWNRLVESIAASGADATLEQRLAKTARSTQATRLQEALDSIPDGFALTDAGGKITMLNDSLGALLGLDAPRDEMTGTMLVSHLLPELDEDAGDDEAARRAQEEEALAPMYAAEGASRSVVVEATRRIAGGERILRVARHPWRNSERGELRGHVWTIRDITQSRLADRMLNEFLDSATHELRTPLTNLKAYAETLSLSDMLEVEQQKEFCNIISSEATRLARLIDDLLDISSMQVGALSAVKQKVDIGRLLNEVVAKVRPQIDQKDQGLEVHISEKLPEMQLDKDKFAAALVNLLGNASKYTPPAGIVRFRAEQMGSHLLIDVEDTGIGISQEDLPRVFNRFFRSSDERVKAEAGSGLGLSLVQEVIHLHGGDVHVASELNQGTKFTVKVPVR